VTTSDPPFTPSGEVDLYAYLAERALGLVTQAMESAGAMQRVRVTSLPDAVMERLCEALQGSPRWRARMLCGGLPDRPWKATATKLIELRNALEEPLLVFVPSGLRTAAEDSLDIATFTELSLAGLSRDLVESLVAELDQGLQLHVRDVFEYLRLERISRHVDQEVEYLLTVVKNGKTPRAAGRSLFVFGLIPDDCLFERSNARSWLSRNHNASRELSEMGRPLRERIGRLPLQPGTLQNDLFTFLRLRQTDNPRHWAAEIACDPMHGHLSLGHWKFVDTVDQELRLILDPLGLPMQAPDRVSGAAQMPVLDLQGRQGLKVSVRSVPPPAQVAAWKSFRFQILSLGEGGESVAWESNNYPKPAGRNRVFSRTIKLADLQVLEEGAYYLKVDAYDQSGALLTKRRPVDPNNLEGRSENESEYFLVTRGLDSADVEPPEPRVIHVPSFVDAYVTVAARQLSSGKPDLPVRRVAITGAWSEPLSASVRGDVHFELQGEGIAGYGVVIPGLIRKLELAILEHPEQLGALRLSMADAKKLADVEPENRKIPLLPDISEAKAFLVARATLFGRLREQHSLRSRTPDEALARTGLVEVADLLDLSDSIEEYGRTFTALAVLLLNLDSTSRETPIARGALAQMDVIELAWRRSPGDPGRALILSPTHPLRLLWHLQHAAFCEQALEAAREGLQKVPSWPDFFKQVREGIAPVSLPLVLFDSRGRGYVEQGPLTSHWSLYLPDRADGDRLVDISGCRDRVRRQLGIKGRPKVATSVGGRDIAARAFEFVQQHPYVDQLRINVFNPGDGQVIADALREIERELTRLRVANEASLLRYSVQMFGMGGDHLEGMGEVLESLLDPDRQVSEDDEFSLTTANHLMPKLIFARNAVEDFLRQPEAFPAHISIFLEHFHARTRLSHVGHLRRGSFVLGLVQEPEIVLEGEELRFGWTRGLRPETGKDPERREKLIREVLDSTQRLEAAAAAGQPQPPDVAPVIALQLDAPSQGLLKQVHDVSDWVVTIDRNLGVEYFDSGTSSREFGYLLDFAPETLHAEQQRVMLTTRSTLELAAIIRPAIEDLGMILDDRGDVVVLETLRSLSGRIALRLLSSPNQSREVVGLLLARWLLGQAGLLEDRIIIPLDAHRAWFQKPTGLVTGEQGSQQRADLLLVGFDPVTSTVELTVVEVKLREGLSDTERSYLYRQMRDQSESTERRLRERFDPELYPVPRADAMLRAKEFMTTLAFYVRRGRRYDLIGQGEAEVALDFVQELDRGYRLEIRSVGVVFERQSTGSHVDEGEPGYTVHRFGHDIAQGLLSKACRSFSTHTDRLVSTSKGGAQAAEYSALPAQSPVSVDAFDSFRSSLGSRTSLRLKPAADGDSAFPRAPIPPDREEVPSSESETPSEMALREEDRPKSVDEQAPGQPVNTDEDSTPDEFDPAVSESDVPADHSSPTSGREAVDEQPGTVEEGLPHAVHSGPVKPDILLGANELTAQYGLIGRFGNAKVAVDLTGCNTISLFGVQGFGKSYTLGVIAEMASRAAEGINVLPAPLATVIFHYHKSDAYAPEFATAIAPNHKPREVESLARDFGAKPAGLEDLVLLTPEAKVRDRRQQFPGIDVRPIQFNSGELGAESWKFLLGAYGNDSFYIRQMVAIMRRHRGELTLERFEQEIRDAELTGAARRLADDRIALARPYINDSTSLASLLRPGRTIIIDLRDEWIEKDEALGLFVVMMRIFAASRHQGREFNKLIVFDEAHKYITESELIGQVVETIREMRHQATSVLIASQDPLSVPRAIVELTSLLILHRMTSPQWLKHLKGAISGLEGVTEGHLAALQPGEALVWAQRATDKRFTQKPQKVTIRPRFSQHGGGTKTAVEGETVR